MSSDVKNKMILCSLDALDYTEKWLEDTVKCLREAGLDGSSAASSDPPSLLSLNVHNHAYLRLLRWDHTSDPFPEVYTLSPESLSLGLSVNCASFLNVFLFSTFLKCF